MVHSVSTGVEAHASHTLVEVEEGAHMLADMILGLETQLVVYIHPNNRTDQVRVQGLSPEPVAQK